MTKPFPYVLLLLLAILFPLTSCSTLGTSAQGDRLARMQASPQYKDEVFVNALPQERKRKKKRNFVDALRMVKSFAERDSLLSPTEALPVIDLSRVAFGAPSTDLTVRWLGHSTMLIEIEGKRILTDPIWSKRASPVQFVGPKRFTPPLIPLEDLPPLDAVLISHDHYDHLDTATIKALKDKVDFYVPLGVGAHLEYWGVAPERIHEMDWWEEATLGTLRIVSTPSRHFSGRSMGDRNHTLWTSWSLVGERRRAFFSGDTGLTPEFAEIGERLGPFDITMLETGAYNQRWADMHMGPEQAVVAHRALRGKIMVPIHWGLFNLAMHTWTEPAERLRVIAQRDGDLIAQPRPGELIGAGLPIPGAQWWPNGEWQTAEESPVWSSAIDPDWLRRYWPAPAATVAR